MKTMKVSPLWQRLGVKTLKKELRSAKPINPNATRGLGLTLADGSEYAKTPCVACGRRLALGRLTSVNLQPNTPAGHWALMHLGHLGHALITGSEHEKACDRCQAERHRLNVIAWSGWLGQGLIDAVHGFRNVEATAQGSQPAQEAA